MTKEDAAEQGLAGLSLRELARRLGMAAPSLYGYFDSKLALYDAMFAAGYRAWLARPAVSAPDFRPAPHCACTPTPSSRLRRGSGASPVLFQRTVPGFSPSEESWALAQQAYERDVAFLLDYPGVQPADLDLITGIFSGLVAQQPGERAGR